MFQPHFHKVGVISLLESIVIEYELPHDCRCAEYAFILLSEGKIEIVAAFVSQLLSHISI